MREENFPLPRSKNAATRTKPQWAMLNDPTSISELDISGSLDLGDQSLAAPAVKLDHNIDNRTSVGDRVRPAQAQAALQNHECNLLHRSARAVGMNGCKRTGMARVYGAQEADRFLAAYLAQYD